MKARAHSSTGPALVECEVADDVAERVVTDGALAAMLLGSITVTPDLARVTLWLSDGARLTRPVCDGETPEQAAAKMLDALGEYIGPIAARAVKQARG